MTVQFTPQGSPSPRPKEWVWIAPAEKEQAEEGLFHFLRTLASARPQVSRPLLLPFKTLRALGTSPHADLKESLHRCLDTVLLDLGPDAAAWGKLDVSPACWGVALAAYNCLTPMLLFDPDLEDPVTEYLKALLKTLPPARTLGDVLVYHALLEVPAAVTRDLPPARADLMRRLLNRSPLTAVYHPHVATPPPLTELAATLLPGWRRRVIAPAPWRNLGDWLGVLVPLLARWPVAAWLRRRWLALPPTRPLCRNLGLLLEALRQRGGWRAFLLEFYEAYDHAWRPVGWPVLAQVRRLQSVAGDSEAVVRLNRCGDEHLILFWALIQTVIADGRMPADYRHLSVDFVRQLRRLLDLSGIGGGRGLDLGNIEFQGEDA
jgi:hypothetical protein